ncbi:MAG TPA: hypothetical protein VLU99_03075 [Nitrososphaerales archaeon]|nr:hypothetical protein [Nitrososphaerales archaeon]
MINTPLVTVAGNYDVTDDIIFCNILQFVGIQPQLVIRPVPGSKVGARRLLKIVANIIDTTGSTGATITYNLDNNFEVPAGNLPSFADPTTQAKAGADGNPNAWQGPLPDTANPNFVPLIDPGPFPRAEDGGDGYDGGLGGLGAHGMDGPTLEIWTTNVIGSVQIDLRGQQGGNGGKGGNGQFGGAGQTGSGASQGTDTSWTGVPYFVCVQQPGIPGDGGRGGNAGCGGDGGDGGNGGFVKIFYTSGVNLAGLPTQLQGGKGGNPGNPGNPGTGGKAGPLALNIPLSCGTGQNAQDGPNGDPCGGGSDQKGGGISQPGGSGVDGTVTTYLVKNIPSV